MTLTAPVFEVQRFSLHDGPGIRSLVFLKGCALHCPWCQNPESQDARPVIAFHRDRCVQSFACEQVCPDGAIERGEFRVAHERCSACGACVSACAHAALRLIGESYTPERLVEELMADRPYYESSGGGVTFSGGEPALYPRFLDRVLDLCREQAIHTNLETAGLFSFELCEGMLRKLDLLYFDLKLLDPALHARHLGGGYPRIADNAERLVGGGFPVEFRLPLVPGFTDTPLHLERVTERLRGLGRSGVHLLAYHNMGEAKIDIIRGSQPRLGLDRYPQEKLAAAAAHFERGGIEVLNRSEVLPDRAQS
ncbi:MAG: glycyl-radical enzyme activating protein [Deltaproteobacteria bacterium]|jgi:pyruvate formate lyase activating enzyme|nr:glycyl-radical enzyme activating protein [Deltaproteobacteria bacterium]